MLKSRRVTLPRYTSSFAKPVIITFTFISRFEFSYFWYSHLLCNINKACALCTFQTFNFNKQKYFKMGFLVSEKAENSVKVVKFSSYPEFLYHTRYCNAKTSSKSEVECVNHTSNQGLLSRSAYIHTSCCVDAFSATIQSIRKC